MRQFNDSKGRAWSVEFTVSAVKRIRGLCDFDPLDGEALQGLAANPVLLVDVLFATIQPQAETQNVTDEEFGAAMGGEAIAAASEALIDEIVNFIRQTDPSKGKFITRSMEKYSEVNARVAQHAINILDTPAIDDAIEREIQKVETDMAKILEPSSGG